MATYLLHFDKPLSHAKHYIGFAKNGNEEKRIAKHENGTSRARIMQVLKERGIGFQVAKI